MNAVFSFFFTILGIVIVAVTFYNFIAVPAGIILLILKAFKAIKLRWRTIILIGFGGVGIIILAFILNFLLHFFAALFGFNLPQTTLPS